MGLLLLLLQSQSWAGELRWSRLPWSFRILWLMAACIALRRAWDACDDAVARSWSALLFDEGQDEVLGSGDGSGGARLIRRCAYGYVYVVLSRMCVCASTSLVHTHTRTSSAYTHTLHGRTP